MRKILTIIGLLFMTSLVNAQDTNQQSCDCATENLKLPDTIKYQKALKDVTEISLGERHFLYPIEPNPETVLITVKDYSLDGKSCQSFETNQDFFKDKDVWATLPKELKEFYQSHENEFANQENRLKKLLGLHLEKTYKCLIEIKVTTDKIIRPTLLMDLKKSEDSLLNFWGNPNYPFTGLGYTCDWFYGDGCRYGLSEFIVKKGNDSKIIKAYAIDDYLKK